MSFPRFFFAITFHLFSQASLQANTPAQAVRLLNEVLGTSSQWGESPAPQCLSSSQSPLSTARPPATTSLSAPSSSNRTPALDPSFNGRGADCSAFISRNGTYGPLGQTIASNVMARGPNSAFLTDNRPGMNDGVRACPKWRELSVKERVRFWVWTFAAIAWDESSCKPNERNPNATNGVAVGLMQLDELPSARKWRGPNCRASSVAAPSQNILCSLDIMEELLKGRQGVYKTDGNLWDTNSYWQKLRTKDGGNIGRLIKTYPLCH